MIGGTTATSSTLTGRITSDISGEVGAIVINNPRQRNALTRQMCIDLAEQVRRLDADPRVKVITLRGIGDDFSAGAAINELDQVLFDAGEGEESIAPSAPPTRPFARHANPLWRWCAGSAWVEAGRLLRPATSVLLPIRSG